ncbi:MAG: trypsin-like peptidase domain-containing protein [Candidatus Paraimprobicoccus trichonymphae]|uniref:Trypsin-like peptidase domain-containing protein n=1 Tax=Candidatus Paraimprobicoccus trichonymphae TaxID=3033793 RepID=A0AA48I558_9FIRM|nr:MAG: trypsin-like peptidase domain-containing protein [Candidatus Paraimprobicoccus trichonymphae]
MVDNFDNKNDKIINNHKKKEDTGNIFKKDNKLKFILIFVVVVLSILVLGFLGFLTFTNRWEDFVNFWDVSKIDKTDENENLNHVNFEFEEPQKNDENVLSAEQVYEKVAPSIVGIVVYGSDASILSDPKGQGSGVIISKNGYIVTNSHVVIDSKNTNVKVVLSDKEELTGKVIGCDLKTDLAVIKVDKIDLKPIVFADSEETKVGNKIYAIGNPAGLDFANSMTCGIISAKKRSLNQYTQNGSYNDDLLQIDAAINPGNSGGAVVDKFGNIVGMSNLKIVLQGYESMGFAIPSNTVKEVSKSLIETGYVPGRVMLGISGRPVSMLQAQIYDVPIGFIISGINKNSDLSNELQDGDIVTKINSKSITSSEVISKEIKGLKVGDTVKLEVFRPARKKENQKTFEVETRLIEDKGAE